MGFGLCGRLTVPIRAEAMMSDDLWLGCPPAETLALWCERKLGGAHKGEVDAHLVVCDRCRHTVIAVCSAIEAGIYDNLGLARAQSHEAAILPVADVCRDTSDGNDMHVIFRGQRARVVRKTDVAVVVELGTGTNDTIAVAIDDRDLLLDPSPDDFALAQMFERGDIGAFEYPDGHTYPPDREIPRQTDRPRRSKIH